MKKKPGVFYVAAYEKEGSQYLVEDCKLADIKLDFLQKIFNINPEDPDIMIRDIVYNLEITEKEAISLQPYINFKFDFKKYDYLLSCRGGYCILDDEEPPY